MAQLIKVPEEILFKKIHMIRDHKVLLDSDLAKLYGIEPRILKQAVRRNIGRFPTDFMFELTKDEWASLRSQIVISKKGGVSVSAYGVYGTGSSYAFISFEQSKSQRCKYSDHAHICENAWYDKFL